MENRWPIEIDGFSWFTYYFNGGSFHGELLVITRGYMPLTSMKCNFCWWMLVSNAPPRWKLQRFHVIHVPSQEMGWSSSTDKHVHMAYFYIHLLYNICIIYTYIYNIWLYVYVYMYCIVIYTQNARILNLVEPTSRHQLWGLHLVRWPDGVAGGFFGTAPTVGVCKACEDCRICYNLDCLESLRRLPKIGV